MEKNGWRPRRGSVVGPRGRIEAVKVVVLTTSYPPSGGTFVAALVDVARERGVDVVVVDPSRFEHFGLAGAHGVLGNLRARPLRAFLLPLFLWNFRRAAARAARDADLVHAHWLVNAIVALTLRRPYVVHVWGTDLELARKLPVLARLLLRRARLTIAPSAYLAGAATRLGARDVVVVATPVDAPAPVADRADPPHVLFVGRLSPEKGIDDFLAATHGLPRVIVGAGPVEVAESVGPVAPAELGAYYDRAAVVAVPSRREGFGMVAREAMAHGCAVVATAVGGLRDAIVDDVTGVLVQPRDEDALRAAIVRLLGDAELRTRLGTAARGYAQSELARGRIGAALLAAYRDATTS